jgi:hypothetical protein
LLEILVCEAQEVIAFLGRATGLSRVVGMFGVPAVWTRIKSAGLADNETKPLTMGQFAKDGIMTATGRLAPRDAAIQMLILPVLIVLWGIATVTIAGIVS